VLTVVVFLKSVSIVHLQKNVPTVHGMSVVVGLQSMKNKSRFASLVMLMPLFTIAMALGYNNLA